ncbi:transposase [Streptomyces sp. NPDC007896]|uniref:transposase n=1 Tax=Streptomyces sp. NPDC007896 TaxID=3364784 RepID=UPI0036EF889E
MLDAMFYKARTGVLGEELPERFSAWKGIHSRYKTWRKCGVWGQIMASLPNAGQQVWTPPLVSSPRVEVDPRMMTEEEAVPLGMGVPSPVSSFLSRRGPMIRWRPSWPGCFRTADA